MDEKVIEVNVDGGIIYTKLNGEITAGRVEALKHDVEIAKDIIRGEHHRIGIKLKSLIDLSNFDGTYEAGALSVLAEYMNENKPYVEKSAAYGAKEMTALAADVVSAMAKRDDIKFFKTREEAFAWLTAAPQAA